MKRLHHNSKLKIGDWIRFDSYEGYVAFRVVRVDHVEYLIESPNTFIYINKKLYSKGGVQYTNVYKLSEEEVSAYILNCDL